MVYLIKYTGLTGLSGSLFSLVDITGLFLFYDITYCLELMKNLEFIVDFQGQIGQKGQKGHLFSVCFFPGRAWRSRV